MYTAHGAAACSWSQRLHLVLLIMAAGSRLPLLPNASRRPGFPAKYFPTHEDELAALEVAFQHIVVRC